MTRALVPLLAALAALLCAGPAAGAVLQATVVRVVDGDTLRVRSRGFDTTVRLLGIDTPETHAPGTPVQCFGPEATARARRLMPVGAALRLETDPTQDTRDRYDRLLAYAFRPGRRGAAGSVNHALVASGHARAYVYRPSGPFRYAPAVLAAERRARTAGLGLWGPPCRGGTVRPRSAPAPAPGGGACHPSYLPCVPVSPSDLDCADVRHAVTVVGADPYRLDGDGDGRGCESW